MSQVEEVLEGQIKCAEELLRRAEAIPDGPKTVLSMHYDEKITRPLAEDVDSWEVETTEILRTLFGENTRQVVEFRGYVSKKNSYFDFRKEIQRELRGCLSFLKALIVADSLEQKVTRTIQARTRQKTVFVSYSHDTPKHEEWVYMFASDIGLKGIKVITDANIRYGQDTNHFMEESISNSDRVLIVVTANYKAKADSRMDGVGYETGIITGELVNNQNTIKFVPVIREGIGNQYYPRYLGNRWGADMKDDSRYNEMVMRLVDDILND